METRETESGQRKRLRVARQSPTSEEISRQVIVPGRIAITNWPDADSLVRAKRLHAADAETIRAWSVVKCLELMQGGRISRKTAQTFFRGKMGFRKPQGPRHGHRRWLKVTTDRRSDPSTANG
jgi:hypothetical protein